MRSLWFGNYWTRKIDRQRINDEIEHAVSHDHPIAIKGSDMTGANFKEITSLSAEECGAIRRSKVLVDHMVTGLQAFLDDDTSLQEQNLDQLMKGDSSC